MTSRRIVGRKPKLTREDQRRLREWAEIGTTRAAVARHFGVSYDTICRYLNGDHKAPVRDADGRAVA